MGEKTSLRSMLKLVWPIFIELLLQILVGNIDQIMISNYQQDAVGAIANANQVLNILLLMFSMISMATTILISQYKGAGDTGQIDAVVTLSFVMNLVLGLGIGVLLVSMSGLFFQWMNVPAVFLAPATEYIQIVGSCCVFQALFLTFAAVFRSHQMMKVSMFASIVMNLTNVAGNALLIYGVGPIPALGVKGVALATVISRIAGLILLIAVFYRSMNGRLRLKHLRPFPVQLLNKILLIGLPAGGESFSYNITQLVILTMVNGFGPDATTARTYCSMIAQIALLYCLSVSQATQVVVGFQVGARQYDAADKTARMAALSSLIITTSLSALIYLLCDPLFSLFGASASVRALCKQVMLIEILLQFGRSFNMLYLRALQGAGDIRFPIAVGIADTWIVVVGLGYLLGCVLGFGLCGIWFAMALDENIRGGIFTVRWHSGVWKKKTLIGSNAARTEAEMQHEA